MVRNEDWIPLSKREKLSIPRMLAMSAGAFFNQANWSLIFQLSTPIMTKIGITGTADACVFLAGIVRVFFMQPTFSALAGQRTRKRGEGGSTWLCLQPSAPSACSLPPSRMK